MRIGTVIAITVFTLSAIGAVIADVNTGGGALQIVLPKDGDEYSTLVARAAAGDKTIDFRALRFAYLKSKAHKGTGVDTDMLRKSMFAAVEAGDNQRVRELAVQLLSAKYIDMWGHKYLRDACFRMHDDACATQARFVEFGLLHSIVATGSAHECKSGFEVVSVEEEYFMLGMIEARDIKQSLIGGTPSCDQMEFTNQDGKRQSYFFRIDAVLADEAGTLSVK